MRLQCNYDWLRRYQPTKWGRYDPSVIPLCTSEIDFRPPNELFKIIAKRMRCESTMYSDVFGLFELRAAIAKNRLNRYKLDTDPENITIVPGITNSLTILAEYFLTKNSHFIAIGTPVYSTLVRSAEKVGAKMHLIDFGTLNTLTLREIQDTFKETIPHVIYVCNPHNPTGKILNKEELKKIIDIAKFFNSIIICDEVYEYLDHSAQFIPIASLAGDYEDKIISLSSFSKIFGINGYRIGHIFGSRELLEKIQSKRSEYLFQTSLLSQYAALACTDLIDSWLPILNKKIRANSEYFHSSLKMIDGIEPIKPLGGFCLWANFKYGNSNQIYEHFLKNGRIAARRPTDFLATNNKGLRFCLATEKSILETSIERIKRIYKKNLIQDWENAHVFV